MPLKRLVASLVRWWLYVIASGTADFSLAGGFASNGYAEHSPGHYSLLASFTAEVAMTFGFLFVILGSTNGRAPKGFAPLAIGFCLTLIHLVSITVTNTSVNPARNTGWFGWHPLSARWRRVRSIAGWAVTMRMWLASPK